MAVTGFDRQMCLQELEGQDWGDPATGETQMISRCLQLRRVPLKDLTVDDLRLLIGQKIGAPYLVPICTEFLEDDPMVEASYYPGDLLISVIQLEDEFWNSHEDSRHSLQAIVRRLRETHGDNEDVGSVLETIPDSLSSETN